VLPKNKEYRLFKTPEQIAANTIQLDSTGSIINIKDPRQKKFIRLPSSVELTRDYTYSSDLNHKEQLLVLSHLTCMDVIHNPRLLRCKHNNNNSNNNKNSPQISPALKEKYENEKINFNKCAEMHYHQHINELNIILRDEVKEFLSQKWNKQLKLIDMKFSSQPIILLIRDQIKSNDNVTVEYFFDKEIRFDRASYTIASNFLSPLHRYSIKDLQCMQKFKREETIKLIETDEENDFNLKVSLDVLTKLFTCNSEFTSYFRKHKHENKIIFLCTEFVPTKNVNQFDAIEDFVRSIIFCENDWAKCNENEVKFRKNAENEFNVKSIDDFMEEILSAHFSHCGANHTETLWNLKLKSQSIKLRVDNLHTYFIDEQTIANISLKLECQTKFGAERMTKDELLREWLHQKLTTNSITLRYRVDIKSLEILSITKLNTEDIENELKEIYECNPNESLNILFNVINTILRLPANNTFMIQSKTEDGCNKTRIYMASSNATDQNTIDFDFGENFTRPFIAIDSNFQTFLHLNHKFPPGCFLLCGFKNKNKNFVKKTTKAIKPTAATVIKGKISSKSNSSLKTNAAKKKNKNRRSKRKIAVKKQV
jgi:hypothetical protein